MKYFQIIALYVFAFLFSSWSRAADLDGYSGGTDIRFFLIEYVESPSLKPEAWRSQTIALLKTVPEILSYRTTSGLAKHHEFHSILVATATSNASKVKAQLETKLHNSASVNDLNETLDGNDPLVWDMVRVLESNSSNTIDSFFVKAPLEFRLVLLDRLWKTIQEKPLKAGSPPERLIHIVEDTFFDLSEIHNAIVDMSGAKNFAAIKSKMREIGMNQHRVRKALGMTSVSNPKNIKFLLEMGALPFSKVYTLPEKTNIVSAALKSNELNEKLIYPTLGDPDDHARQMIAHEFVEHWEQQDARIVQKQILDMLSVSQLEVVSGTRVRTYLAGVLETLNLWLTSPKTSPFDVSEMRLELTAALKFYQARLPFFKKSAELLYSEPMSHSLNFALKTIASNGQFRCEIQLK